MTYRPAYGSVMPQRRRRRICPENVVRLHAALERAQSSIGSDTGFIKQFKPTGKMKNTGFATKTYITRLVEAFILLNGTDESPSYRGIDFRIPIKIEGKHLRKSERQWQATGFAIVRGGKVLVEYSSIDWDVDGSCKLDEVDEKYHDALLTALVEAVQETSQGDGK